MCGNSSDDAEGALAGFRKMQAIFCSEQLRAEEFSEFPTLKFALSNRCHISRFSLMLEMFTDSRFKTVARSARRGKLVHSCLSSIG